MPAYEVLAQAEELDFEKAVIVPTSFVERTLRAVESDVIWKIPFRGNRTCLV